MSIIMTSQVPPLEASFQNITAFEKITDQKSPSNGILQKSKKIGKQTTKSPQMNAKKQQLTRSKITKMTGGRRKVINKTKEVASSHKCTTMDSSQDAKQSREFCGGEPIWFNIESESENSVCSEPMMCYDNLENSDMYFNIDFTAARQEGRARTHSFECNYHDEEALETRCQVALPVATPHVVREIQRSVYSSSSEGSEFFETISECSVNSLAQRFANNLQLQTPQINADNWLTASPKPMQCEFFYGTTTTVIGGIKTIVPPDIRKNVLAYGNPINFVHDQDFFRDLVSALS